MWSEWAIVQTVASLYVRMTSVVQDDVNAVWHHSGPRLRRSWRH